MWQIYLQLNHLPDQMIFQSASANMIVHAIFKGSVQGVGFRATVLKLAKKNLLKGTVANLKDGTVEAFFQGNEIQIEQCMHEIQDNFGKKIQDVSFYHIQPMKSYDQFLII